MATPPQNTNGYPCDPRDDDEAGIDRQESCIFWKRPCILPPCSAAPKPRSFMILKEESSDPFMDATIQADAAAAGNDILSNDIPQEEAQPREEEREEPAEWQQEAIEQELILSNKQCVLFPSAFMKRPKMVSTVRDLSSPTLMQQNMLSTRAHSIQLKKEQGLELTPEELLADLLLMKHSKSGLSQSKSSSSGTPEAVEVSNGGDGLSISKPLWKRRLSFSRKVNSSSASSTNPVNITIRQQSTARSTTKSRGKSSKDRSFQPPPHDTDPCAHSQAHTNGRQTKEAEHQHEIIHHLHIRRDDWDNVSNLSIMSAIAAEGSVRSVDTPPSWDWMEKWLAGTGCNYNASSLPATQQSTKR